MLLYAGYVSDASQLLHKLLERDERGNLRDDLFCANLMLAGQCLAARPILYDVSLWETVIKPLFETLTTSSYSLTQKQTAETFTAIGGTKINTQLLHLLSDEQIDNNVRGSITEALGQLGERSVVPQLVSLLSDEQIDSVVRGSIAEVLGKHADTEQIIQDLVELLATSDLADEIHRALWSASRQADVRIYMSDGQMGQLLRIVKRSSAKDE